MEMRLDRLPARSFLLYEDPSQVESLTEEHYLRKLKVARVTLQILISSLVFVVALTCFQGNQFQEITC